MQSFICSADKLTDKCQIPLFLMLIHSTSTVCKSCMKSKAFISKITCQNVESRHGAPWSYFAYSARALNIYRERAYSLFIWLILDYFTGLVQLI